MKNLTRFETANGAREFDSRARTIRSKNLRQFLKLYHLTYVSDRTSDPLEFTGPKKPKIRPGLRFIRRYLGCSKGTAQDYLRAIQITHDIFVRHELEKSRFLTRIDRKSYENLQREITRDFECVAVRLGATKESSEDGIKFKDVRKYLYNVAATIERTSGVFTPKDCAEIIRELASWFY